MMPGDSSDYLKAPKVLNEDTYDLIEYRVLGKPLTPARVWEQAAGSCVMHPSWAPPETLTPAHSLSLRQQLHQVVTWPGTLDPSFNDKPPEGFLFIRPEGVALRHVLDGFYNALYGGRRRHSNPKRPPVALLPVDVLSYRRNAIEVETARLKNFFGNIGHICLIDNNATLFDSSELQFVANIVREAGVPHISALRTVLYDRIDPREVNLQKLEVPPHAKFLHRLGKLCCNLDYPPR